MSLACACCWSCRQSSTNWTDVSRKYLSRGNHFKVTLSNTWNASCESICINEPGPKVRVHQPNPDYILFLFGCFTVINLVSVTTVFHYNVELRTLEPEAEPGSVSSAYSFVQAWNRLVYWEQEPSQSQSLRRILAGGRSSVRAELSLLLSLPAFENSVEEFQLLLPGHVSHLRPSISLCRTPCPQRSRRAAHIFLRVVQAFLRHIKTSRRPGSGPNRAKGCVFRSSCPHVFTSSCPHLKSPMGV